MSNKAKALSARLLAVQALYQADLNAQPLSDVAAEYLEHRLGMEVEGEALVAADKALFTKIMRGVEERGRDLADILKANCKDEGKRLEPLIKAILMCASYELLAHNDIDSPIIINDYLNVGHSFFESGEVSLINGVLDAVSKVLRDAV